MSEQQSQNKASGVASELNDGLGCILAKKHTGMKIDGEGILGRIRDGRMYPGLKYACGEMLKHMEEMASRFYSGDVKAVDEFLQLYCLDEKRPNASGKPTQPKRY